jgi:protoheme IX farnesyltransferase
MIGSSLVIACGCVINNYIDRNIDRKMARTKQRALVTGQVRPRLAMIYAAGLGISGFAVLSLLTNRLTVAAGIVGLFFYLVMYSIWKRKAPIGTVVGSVSGATPIFAGYTAATDRFDTAAVLLFLAMVLWQMPHFYAIAMYRFKDYQQAGLPVLPVRKGMQRAKLEILIYVAAFTVAATALTLYHFTGYIYLVVMVVLGLIWFWKGAAGFKTLDDNKFGRKMFFFSLVVLLTFSTMVALGALLP